MVLSITRAAGSCGNFPQLHTPAAWLPHGVLTEKCGACHCGKGRDAEKSLAEQPGSSRKYKSFGRGRVFKGWEGPEKVKPREVREACLLARIPHRIERPHGILPQCVSERGIDSNQEWEVRPGEELQGI